MVSPAESRVSISRSPGSLATLCASDTRRSVVPPIAETTATML
jgi:hypothetical protein